MVLLFKLSCQSDFIDASSPPNISGQRSKNFLSLGSFGPTTPDPRALGLIKRALRGCMYFVYLSLDLHPSLMMQ